MRFFQESSRLVITLQAYTTLFKTNLVVMVVITALMGYVAALTETTRLDFTLAFHLAIGVFCAGSAAHAFNQLLERKRDALMPRTHKRPIPTGQISTGMAASTGSLLILGALLYLYQNTSLLTSGLTALTFVCYVLIYTPLKPISKWNTWVGAVVGALPPMIGWSAANTNILQLPILFLFLVLFTWQIPHFLALAWKYKKEYRKAGFLMLPEGDKEGKYTTALSLLHSLLLLCSVCGYAYFADTSGLFWGGAVLLSLWFLGITWRFFREKTQEASWRVFIASIIYMPIFVVLTMLDTLWYD